jgi:glutamate formiminotransferase / formiminotetrahydrofolate cyclodeaminase
MKLVECVPNISEGCDERVLAELSKTIASVTGISLLDVDSGVETHRTVFTFVGAPEAAVEAAFALVARAADLIDMRKHKGTHPRIGAVDVMPFVPLSGMTLGECAELARRVAERVGRELHIPTYLYEAAASRAERRNLADVRKGEYEGLPGKLKLSEWKPDFGPTTFEDRQARSGACIIGARPFLVAYNVNLNSKDKRHANEIAFSLRESGRQKRDEAGNVSTQPGTLKTVKATGWVIEEYKCAQVSMNLTNLEEVGLAAAFEECVRQADRIGVRVTGSEIIGLVPKDELLRAGRYFLQKMGKPVFAPEREVMETAVRSLGLSELSPFVLDKKVIEYHVAKRPRLASMTVSDFCDEVSRDTATPGGGSVAALLGALSGALSSMVASISTQKNESDVEPELGLQAQSLKAQLQVAIDDDSDAFESVLSAMRLPKTSSDEQAERAFALERANQLATRVPLAVMRLGRQAAALATALTSKAYKPSQSDAFVAALAALACVEGAFYNVRVNVKSVTDRAFAEESMREATQLLTDANRLVLEARRVMNAT